MKLRQVFICAGIMMLIAGFSPMTVHADTMDDYAGYDYMKQEDKEKIEKNGITKYQRKQIESLCEKLGINAENYIKENYYGILIGVKQKELENEYVRSQGYSNGSETVEIEGTTYELIHDYRYDYENDRVVDNTMYCTELDDASSDDAEGYTYYNHFKDVVGLPAFDWSDGSFFHNSAESNHIMRVYQPGAEEAAVATAIAAGETSFMLEDRTATDEFAVTYYADGKPVFTQKTGVPYLDENTDTYLPRDTKYYDMNGDELSDTEYVDAFNKYYSSLGEEYKEVTNVAKQQYACRVKALLINGGGDSEAAQKEYEETLQNIDNASMGELWEMKNELEALQREIKAQTGAVMKEATHYLTGEIDIDPQFADVDSAFADDVQKYIQQYVNDYRKSKGVGEVEISSSILGAFADTRAIEACYLYRCDHRRPDESELTFSDVPVSENLVCVPTGSKLSAQELARTAVDSWIKSYGHELNLRNETHKSMNVGLAAKMVDGQLVYYIAQDFSATPPTRLDEEYKDADTSVIEPKVKAAKGEETYTDDEGTEWVNIAGADYSGNSWTHPIVGDVIEINGKVPNRISTNRNGDPSGNSYNVVMYDSNNQVLCMTTLITQGGPPDYVGFPYVYIGYYSIFDGGYGQFVPVGSDSSAVSGNITNYWSFDDGGTHQGGNWDLVNKYMGGY